jgi:hypothetical protein
MPDEFCLLVEIVPSGVPCIVITVAAWEHDYSDFHGEISVYQRNAAIWGWFGHPAKR